MSDEAFINHILALIDHHVEHLDPSRSGVIIQRLLSEILKRAERMSKHSQESKDSV